MSKFAKKFGKVTGDIVGDALKKTFSAVLSDIIKELVEETGVKDIAQDKMMDVGFKIIKQMNIDPKNLQKELIKNALKKEFNL